MIHIVERPDFLDFVNGNQDAFMKSIADNNVYIVKNFYPRDLILAFRERLIEISERERPSWHPCTDGVPDYHRINDEYEGSWVRARMHGFYFHPFNSNGGACEPFRDILRIKNRLRGVDQDADYEALPSSGRISRVVSQHYPRGGGYLKEHIDPHSDFALIQTIVQASTPGVHFNAGGLYMRERENSPALHLDEYSDIGDLFVLTPAVRHGVAPIDPDMQLDWNLDNGRLMILPLVLESDYNMNPDAKPKQVGT